MKINWQTNPRIIAVVKPATSITIKDLWDTINIVKRPRYLIDNIKILVYNSSPNLTQNQDGYPIGYNTIYWPDPYP